MCVCRVCGTEFDSHSLSSATKLPLKHQRSNSTRLPFISSSQAAAEHKMDGDVQTAVLLVLLCLALRPSGPQVSGCLCAVVERGICPIFKQNQRVIDCVPFQSITGRHAVARRGRCCRCDAQPHCPAIPAGEDLACLRKSCFHVYLSVFLSFCVPAVTVSTHSYSTLPFLFSSTSNAAAPC